ncbi:hypothetical protein C1T21_12315 [Paenibacillus sp. F4]|nr:hypothetical protein C1T21_12315 [Paenibacillus sp. F4]
MIPNVLFIIRIPPEMIGLPIMQYDNGFKYEDFAKIQLATSNEQYIDRNVSFIYILHFGATGIESCKTLMHVNT